jgi:hypothetical protein
MKKSLTTPDAEIQKLKATVKLLRNELSEKTRLLQSYERDWALKLFDDLQTIQNEYSLLLKPPPVVVKGSFKNQGYSFQIKVGDIVGLFSKRRTKVILLNKPTSCVGGYDPVTDVIYTETGFPELLKQLDQSNFHFCQVNRSCCVNIRYYDLVNTELVIDKMLHSISEKYARIKISKRNVADFISKKNSYRHISSLQKDQFRYILDSIMSGLNSFTKNKTMSKAIKPADNSANQQNPNKDTGGTNKQYSQNQGNRGKQMNPKSTGKKGK